MRQLKQSRTAFLVFGLVAGLVAGLNLQGNWPSVELHATATHGQDNFAIATGYVDSDVEAIYFLDFLTGDMKAAVVALRPGARQGKFNAFFTRNILNDFGGLKNNKNPKYLMVTGEANIPRGSAGFQYARSVVYVAEATTGIVSAYTIPWNTTAHASLKPIQAEFIPLDQAPFRAAVGADQ